VVAVTEAQRQDDRLCTEPPERPPDLFADHVGRWLRLRAPVLGVKKVEPMPAGVETAESVIVLGDS
jgi:hypothetical protein